MKFFSSSQNLIFTIAAAILVTTNTVGIVNAQNATSDPLGFLGDGSSGGDSGGGGPFENVPKECEDSLQVFGFCFLENMETCSSSCNETIFDPSLSSASCDSVCAIADCCTQCKDDMLDFLSCIVSNSGAESSCTFDCVEDDSNQSGGDGGNSTTGGGGGGSGGGGSGGDGSSAAAGSSQARTLVLMIFGSALALLLVY